MTAWLRIHWLRILLGALLVEVVLFALVVPLRYVPNGTTIEYYAVLPECLIATFVGGWWVARGAPGRGWILGAGLGAVAALMYAALTWKYPLPVVFIVANYAKIFGGALGGVVGARARQSLALERT